MISIFVRSLIALSLMATTYMLAEAELLGELSIEELHVQPNLSVSEPSQGGFSFRDSSFAVLWKKVGGLSALIRVGSVQQIGIPQYIASNPGDELGLYEAYGRFQGVYGDIQMGLIPVGFSILGMERESQLLLPRPLLFRERWVLLRDYGFSFTSTFSGWMSRLVLHNGEGGEAVDNNTWVTMQWGWNDRKFFKWLVSAQAGESGDEAMVDSQSKLAGLDINQSAFWRIGGASLQWSPHRWHSLFEIHYGEKEQGSEVIKFVTGHFDLAYRFDSDLQLLFRLDQMEPNGAVEKDQITEYSLGVAYFGQDSNSRFLLLATSVEEEGVDMNNNRLLLEWRLTPIANPKNP